MIEPRAVRAPWGGGWEAQVLVHEPNGDVCQVDCPRRFAEPDQAMRLAQRIAASILLGKAREGLQEFRAPAPGTFVSWDRARFRDSRKSKNI